MEAFAERADLRVRIVKAMTGTPTALLRRLPADALASQVDLLATDDLPEAERSVRAEADRSLSVHELYLKYLDPSDIVTYVPAASIWRYEAQDEWWKAESSASARSLMAAELRSIRRHAIMTDSEIVDLVGEETLERHLSLAVRTGLRKAARKAASEGRPFTDADLFSSVEGSRGLIDEMVESVPLPQLREVIEQVAAMLGLREPGARSETARTIASNASPAAGAATAETPLISRVGPKMAPPSPPPARKTVPGPVPTEKRGGSAPKSLPHASSSDDERTVVGSVDAPPQPDDDLAFLDELTEGV
jgi:hypothetical protein